MKGIFSRSYCCYGNLLCHENDNNVLTILKCLRSFAAPSLCPSLPLPSNIIYERSSSWRQSTNCIARANHNARNKWSIEKSTNQFHGVFFYQILAKRRFLTYVSNLLLLFAEFLETSDRIAVYGHSLQEFGLWITNFHRGLEICLQKPMLPKDEKDWKNDWKTSKVSGTSSGYKYLKSPWFT